MNKKIGLLTALALMFSTALGIDSNSNVTPVKAEDEFKLLTSTDQLVIGSKIIIAASSANVAMSSQNTNNWAECNIEKSADKKSLVEYSNAEKFTLCEGKENGSYAFKTTADKYIYAASSTSNNLKSQAYIDGNASWSIEINTNNEATIKAKGTNTKNLLQHNKTSPLFSCYSSAQGAISIYINSLENYTVSYFSEGVTIDSEIVSKGSYATRPETPTKESNELYSYEFGGWYSNETFEGEEFNFEETQITSNVDLYAKWIKKTNAYQNQINEIQSYFSLAYSYSIAKNDLIVEKEISVTNDSSITNQGKNKSIDITDNFNDISHLINIVYNTNDSDYFYVKKEGIRLYNASSANGSTITVSSKDNVDLISCVFNLKEGYTTGALESSNDDSFSIQNTNTSKQVRISSITIKYVDHNSYKYCDVDFRLKFGVDSTIADIDIENKEYGIEVSDGTSIKKFATPSKFDSNNNINYVIIDLGDVINDIDRSKAEFTVRAYLTVDGETYYSSQVKNYSVKSMIKAYYDNNETKDQVEPVYSYFNQKGLYNN